MGITVSSVHPTPKHMGGRAGTRSIPPHGAVLGVVCLRQWKVGLRPPQTWSEMASREITVLQERRIQSPNPPPASCHPRGQCLHVFSYFKPQAWLNLFLSSRWAEETNGADAGTWPFDQGLWKFGTSASIFGLRACPSDINAVRIFFSSLFFEVQSCNSDTWFLMWKHPTLQTGSVFDVSPFKCSRRALQKCGICKPPSWLFLSAQLSAAMVLNTCKGKEGAHPPCCWVIKIMANPIHYPLMWLLNMHHSPNKCKSVWESLQLFIWSITDLYFFQLTHERT